MHVHSYSLISRAADPLPDGQQYKTIEELDQMKPASCLPSE